MVSFGCSGMQMCALLSSLCTHCYARLRAERQCIRIRVYALMFVRACISGIDFVYFFTTYAFCFDISHCHVHVHVYMSLCRWSGSCGYETMYLWPDLLLKYLCLYYFTLDCFALLLMLCDTCCG